MKDINGRAYALVSEVEVNDRLEADDRFTCIEKGEVCTVHADMEFDKYIYCTHGVHYIDVDDKLFYTGFYKV